jgi:hypothetical protein
LGKGARSDWLVCYYLKLGFQAPNPSRKGLDHILFEISSLPLKYKDIKTITFAGGHAFTAAHSVTLAL